MRNIFLPNADLTQPSLSIEGADAHHLGVVLRARIGESVRLLDDRGAAVTAEITESYRRSITVRVLGPASVACEPPVCVAVAQALGKGDKFEQVIQHGTEVGASTFIPLLTERSVVKLDGDSVETKMVRYRAIVKGAAEQSGRARIPAVVTPMTVGEAASITREYDWAFCLDPSGEPLWERLKASKTSPAAAGVPRILVLVGPEGGFAPEEIDTLRQSGACAVSLGEHILRTETAALVAVSQLLFACRAGIVRSTAE